VWRAFVSRGDHGDANDTKATIVKIVKLRAERAKLLGFASHASFRMDDTMAKDPKAAMELMMKVWGPAVARVHEDVADMQKIADAEGQKITIEPWDYRFYADKVRKARYAIDQSEIKPYFALENMIQGAMWSAEKLYGLHFAEITGKGVPVFNADVRVWTVTDAKTGKSVGLFYGDYFARAGKRSGAWATGYRGQRRLDGPVTPLVSDHNNFVKAAKGRAGAHHPARRAHALPRVRPRPPGLPPERRIPRPRGHAARLRRVPQPGERALGADARRAEQVRPPPPDRRADAARARRED